MAQASDDVKTSLTSPQRKSVNIRDDNVQIVEVGEKHGPLYNAIPTMPLPVAALCCVFNILVPGLGTLISSFSVLCGAKTRVDGRAKAFALNVLAAFLQMITFIIIVGWVWSIIWGMNMVQMAVTAGEKRLPYYVRRQSSVECP